MEIGSSPKAPGPAGPLEPLRAEPTVAGAVKTALPPEASVQAVKETPAVALDLTDGAAGRAAIEAALQRRVIVDAKTKEVLYQTVDERTGEVVRQVPDETLMRLRAYSREMREKAQASDTPHVERIA